MTPLAAARHHNSFRVPRAVGVLAAAILIVGLADVAGTLGTATHMDGAKAIAAGAPDASRATTLAPAGESGGLPAIGSVAQINHSITAWTANVAANPDDFISATNLAILYHARGRLTGDLDDQTRALTAARMASTIAPTQTAAKSLEATILYTLHDFTNAVAAADALYRANPADLSSLATIATGRAAYGFVLVVGFGLGMACVLGGVGLALVLARDRVDRLPDASRIGRFAPLAPLASGVVVMTLGVYLTTTALGFAPAF